MKEESRSPEQSPHDLSLYLIKWYEILCAERLSLKEFLELFVCSEESNTFSALEKEFALSCVPASLLCGFDARVSGMEWRAREERKLSAYLLRVSLPRFQKLSESALVMTAEHVELISRGVREVANYLDSWRDALNSPGSAPLPLQLRFMKREFEPQFVFFSEFLRVICEKCVRLMLVASRQQQRRTGGAQQSDGAADLDTRVRDIMRGGIVCKTMLQAMAAKLLVLPGVKLRAQYGVKIQLFPPEEFELFAQAGKDGKAPSESSYRATTELWDDSISFYHSCLAESFLRP